MTIAIECSSTRFTRRRVHGDDGWWSARSPQQRCYMIVCGSERLRRVVTNDNVHTAHRHIDLRHGPGTAGHHLLATTALPNTNRLTLHVVLYVRVMKIVRAMCRTRNALSSKVKVQNEHTTDDTTLNTTLYLSTEGARVGGVLGDFHLLDLLTQRRTVARAVLAHNANLLGALCLVAREA